MNYRVPQDKAADTLPHKARGVDHRLRTAPIELRLKGVKEAHHVVESIDGGRGEEVARANLRRKRHIGASSQGPGGVRWDEWKRRKFLDHVTAMGHSIGGATAGAAVPPRAL